MAREISKSYSHREIESEWYSRWVTGGHFRPASTGGKAFSMVIPPPNVTGSLHMGHALNTTLQDVLCRYKRMDGYRVLWVCFLAATRILSSSSKLINSDTMQQHGQNSPH